MNFKITCLLLIVFFYPVMSMEIIPSKDYSSSRQHGQSLLQHLPQDTHKEILSYMVTPQWWYLQDVFAQNYCVNSVCFNSSGTQLATGNSNGEACIFNLATKEQKTFSQKSSVNSVCFNSSGSQLVTGRDTFFSHAYRFNSVCFNSSDSLLATGSSDGKTHIFDIKTQQQVPAFSHVNSINYAVNSVCFNSSGTQLATGSNDKKARIFDVATQQQVAVFSHDSSEYFNAVNSVCFNSSGSQLATACYDGKTRIFDVATQQQVAIFSHDGSVYSVCFNPSGTQLATGCSNGKACIFDITTKKQVAIFSHYGRVNSVCFNPSGTQLATAGYDRKTRIFTRYDDWTLEQLQLKYKLLTWLLIEKPNKTIDSFEELLEDAALKHECSYNELFTIWNTLPKYLQTALWRTMQHKIQTYGTYEKNKFFLHHVIS